MSHGTEGKTFDRIDLVWRDEAQARRVQQIREELAFLRQARQGELQCPMIIKDGMDPVQSQLDGKHYDSKSNLRRTYRAGGVEEVGNDPDYTDPERMKRQRHVETASEAYAKEKALRETIQRGISLANLTTSTPGDEIKIKDWEHPGGPKKLYGGVKP